MKITWADNEIKTDWIIEYAANNIGEWVEPNAGFFGKTRFDKLNDAKKKVEEEMKEDNGCIRLRIIKSTYIIHELTWQIKLYFLYSGIIKIKVI